MLIVLLAILIFSLCFAGIALRVILKKDKEFRGTCGSMNPALRKDDGTCNVCGQKVTEPCPEGKDKKASL